MSIKLGEILLREKHITEEQLQQALAEQKRGGFRLGHAVVKLGFVKDETIAAILSRQYGVRYIDLTKVEIDPQVLRKIPADTAHKYLVIPVSRNGQDLTVAMADPTNIFAMDEIRYRTGYHVKPLVATETAIQDAIEKYLGKATSLELKESERALMELDDPDVEVLEETDELDLEELERGSEDAPVVQLVNHILTDAVRRGASDIHIEPFERELRVRCRIDGILYLVINPPLKLKENITTRIKILAKLDIAERRIPQGGRFKIRTKGNGKMRELEFRVSVLPTLFGEKVVLRLLDKDQLQLDMTKLGFERASLSRFEQAILKPWGMVLVTGPTGSGKTNTLYSAISRLNTMETNIMTAEDPVEFN
ncbi:MAG: GspE/PulE family protein, partial [Vicinamibacteria bacterium]